MPFACHLFPNLFSAVELFTKTAKHMSKDEEYRRRAAECRRMAANAISPDDKQAWLKLADSWLQMLPKESTPQHWPKASDEDSKESH
jgi:hypothetical protein